MKLPSLATGQVQVVSTPPTAALREYTQKLAERAQAIRAGLVHPADDNLLKVTADGRKASVFNGPPPTWPTPPDRTKLEDVTARVWRHYCDSDDERGAQLVFCDLYTPKTTDADDGEYYSPTLTAEEQLVELGVYGRLKGLLVARGIAPSEIVFAQDHKSARSRAQLHAAIRSGEVRVCIGSTPLIGQAVNVQDRLIALHHLDCPWRPDELEQRTRRGIRQGNRYGEVHVYVYVTEGSYDPVVWQIVEGKARNLAQIMSGKATRRVADDIGAVVLTASMAKAVALGDSRVLTKVRLEVELYGLERRWLSWLSSRTAYRRDVAALPAQIDELTRRACALQSLAGCVNYFDELVIDGRTVPLQDGNVAVRALWQSNAYRRQTVTIGSWRGFALWLEPLDDSYVLSAKAGRVGSPPLLFVTGVGFSSSRPLDSLGQMLDAEWLQREARAAETKAAGLRRRVASASAALSEPWPGRAEVERLLAEYASVCNGTDADSALPDRVSFRFRWD